MISLIANSSQNGEGPVQSRILANGGRIVANVNDADASAKYGVIKAAFPAKDVVAPGLRTN